MARHIVADLARAFAVLALVFLSYAHQPIDTATASPHDVLTAAVTADFCGGAPADDGKAHAPCHACRIGGGADLPPPPCAAIDAPVAAVGSIYASPSAVIARVVIHASARPRAPPALV